MLESAEAYKQRKINESHGDASRFTQVAAEYARASEVNGRRLYVETMEQILPRIKKPVRQIRYDDSVREFQRITMDPEIMGGKPCVRGTRVTVGMIVEALAAGRSIEQLLAGFPYLEEQDIRQALAFAARLVQGHEIRLAG